MKLVGNYNEDVKNLIDGDDQYIIPVDIVKFLLETITILL